MEHNHTHSHDHTVTITRITTALVTGIVLNLLFVLIETGYGLYIHSLSLLSDAGHNLTDVATLALSLLAFRLLKVKANKYYTYGYRKTSIIIALFNALVLLISVAVIIYEAIQRFFQPQLTPGITIAIIAGIGVLINSSTAFLFLRNKEKDINIRSAYLHLLSDALVSFGIVIGGIVIFYTQWFWIDSVLSLLVAVVILYTSWGILRDSLRLSLDGIPAEIDLDDIKTMALKINGIQKIYHVHIWAISSTENALTAHLVLEKNTSHEEEQKIKDIFRHELLHKNIHHATLETERENEGTVSKSC